MRLLPPADFVSTQVDGHDYAVGPDGLVEVGNPDHVAELIRSHGFVDPRAAKSRPLIVQDEALSSEAIISQAVARTLAELTEDYPNLIRVLGENAVDLTDAYTDAELLDLLELSAGEAFTRFAAFDPDGDGRPGGSLLAAKAEPEPTEAAADPAPGDDTPHDDEDDTATLYGSSAFGAEVAVGPYTVLLGGVVLAAFDTFGATLDEQADAVAAWNDLAEADRDARIQAAIDALSADPDAAREAIPNEYIVAGLDPAPGDDAQDPAERPDFDSWGQPETLEWLKVRQVTWKGNPSKAVAHQMAHDYWDAKYGPRA